MALYKIQNEKFYYEFNLKKLLSFNEKKIITLAKKKRKNILCV